MQVFTNFSRSELTDDQLLPVSRQLLPVLMNILGQAEVGFSPAFGQKDQHTQELTLIATAP